MTLGYLLASSIGLTGESKSRQNVGRPCPFSLIPKVPDFCAALEKACPSVHRVLHGHLLGTGLASPALMGSPGLAPGSSTVRGSRARWPAGEATTLLMKGLYQPPSAATSRITHRPPDGSPFFWGPECKGAGISHSRATRSSHQEILV